MRITLIVISIIFHICSIDVKSQVSDSLRSKMTVKKAIIPTTLVGLGLIVNNSRFEKKIKLDIQNRVGDDFEFRIDDYFQYAPVAEMYIADVFGVKSKNHWFDQTKYLLISNLITASITHALKRTVLKIRPNDSPYSFPSGHTTFAFTNASVLYNEFSQSSPLIAYSGFAFATTTGLFRMINNKHWLSDVLVGAGIGIIITDLVYHFEPLKNFNPFKKSHNTSFIPVINYDNYGFYFSLKF